jgi:hypothetical protein
MSEYRIYFLNSEGHIRAREEFAATDDRDALKIAVVLIDLCSDVYNHFMLWSGSREVWDSTTKAFVSETPIRAADLPLPMQQRVADIAEAILDSHRAISRSKTLLADDISPAAEERRHKGGDDEVA